MCAERQLVGTTVVIVNYRTKELTAEAARSALAEPDVGGVIVVDNASGDASAAYLRATVDDARLSVVETDENIGFGRAVNLAASTVTSDFMLILNSDATLLPGCVPALARVLRRDPSIGLVAPAVYESDGCTLQAGAYGTFPKLLPLRGSRQRNHGSESAPDWVSGVTMMLPRQVFVELGGFDPDFEMYLEDVDFCRRLRTSGREVVREPTAGVVHLGGRSWSSSVHQRNQYHISKSTYFRKHGAGRPAMALLRAVRVGRVALAWVGSIGREHWRPGPPASKLRGGALSRRTSRPRRR